jgi:hypothetical protein
MNGLLEKDAARNSLLLLVLGLCAAFAPAAFGQSAAGAATAASGAGAAPVQTQYFTDICADRCTGSCAGLCTDCCAGRAEDGRSVGAGGGKFGRSGATGAGAEGEDGWDESLQRRCGIEFVWARSVGGGRRAGGWRGLVVFGWWWRCEWRRGAGRGGEPGIILARASECDTRADGAVRSEDQRDSGRDREAWRGERGPDERSAGWRDFRGGSQRADQAGGASEGRIAEPARRARGRRAEGWSGFGVVPVAGWSAPSAEVRGTTDGRR